MSRGPIIVALDYDRPDDALAMADRLDAAVCRVKVGKQLFTRGGPDVVRALHERGFEVFLDLKFHDIPNTVAGACRAAADLGVWMVNVHAGGGRGMLAAARDAIDPGGDATQLIGVTVLTSLDDADLARLGIDEGVQRHVERLATLTRDAGLDGVVCSPRETAALRERFGAGFVLVTPGIRPAGSDGGDQKRVTTPAAAVTAGTSYMVIGRAITGADDPMGSVAAIRDEVDGALSASA